MSPSESDFWSTLPTQDEPEVEKTPGSFPLDFVQRYKRLKRYNAQRIQLVRKNLDKQRCRVFDLIPLLVHHPMAGLPGGEVAESPVGIINFEPHRELDEALRSFFPQIHQRSWVSLQRPGIISLFVMGSMGTVAQTSTSDLDLWVVVDERNATGKQLSVLTHRLGLVEKWAAVQGLEVHFFCLTAKQIRECDFGRIARESAGTALKSMLIEEFFRTHILLQGKAPLWWLAEPFCSESDYLALDASVRWEKRLDPESFVDLGQPKRIPDDEFLGACLWQMVKSLRRPFKSLLKMTLVARHLDHPDPPLLCETLKARLLSKDELGPLDVDPYMILVDTLVEEYYQSGSPDTGRLLRQSFYLQLFSGGAETARTIDGSLSLRRLAEHWRWSTNDIVHLERFQKWNLRTIDSLGRGFQVYLEQILDRLWQRVGDKTEQAIHREDLVVLDRKIRGARGQHPNQIELLYTGYYPGNLVLRQLIFSFQSGGWQLYLSGDDTPLSIPYEKLGHALAWVAVNGLYGKNTSVVLEGARSLSPSSVRSRLARMVKTFDGVRPEDVPVDEFANELRSSRILVEVFSESRSSIDQNGTQKVSEQWDLLQYGDVGNCLIDRVLIWTVTNWGTVTLTEHSGPDGLVEALVILLRQKPVEGRNSIRFVSADGMGGGRSGARRLEMLHDSADRAMMSHALQSPKTLFLVRSAGSYFVIFFDSGYIRKLGPLDLSGLNTTLSTKELRDCCVVADSGSVHLAPVVEALALTSRGQESVYIVPDHSQIALIAVDPVGSLFLAEMATSQKMETIVKNLVAAAPDLPMEKVGRLVRLSTGEWEKREINLPRSATDIEVQGELSEAGGFRFQVTGFQQPATTLDEAVVWVMSRHSIGRERMPSISLGEVRYTGENPDVVTRLRIIQRLNERLVASYSKQRMKMKTAKKIRVTTDST
jgi:adenylate cyclase class 1